MKKDLTFCLHCKKNTGNKNIHIVTKKGHTRMKSICTICGHKKSTFVSSNDKQSGKGVVDKFIEKLPVELHLLGTDENTGKIRKSSFIGPGTKLSKRLDANNNPKDFSKPINDLDRAAYAHDLCYRDHTDAPTRNKCDADLTAKAKQFLNKPGISTLDKIDRNIVIKAMNLIKRKV